MTRKGSLLTMVFLAVIVLVSSVGRAQEASVSQAIQKPDAESLVPEVDICPEEKPMTLEELKATFGAHKVCNVPCYPSLPYPYFSCTDACGEGAGCFDGYCLYW